MDSGYLEPGETMEDDFDFGQDLLPEEIIGIIDQLLCHEVIYDPMKRWEVANVTDGMAHGTPARANDLH